MNKIEFEKIKKLHGDYASWAIWADQDVKPKSNIGDLSILDPDQNNELLSKLKPNIILVALNFSRGGVRAPFANFHDANPNGQDFKIRYALKNSPYWGGYMTDVIKNYNEVDSKKLMSYLKKNKPFEDKNIKKVSKLYYLSTYSLLYPILAMIYIRTYTNDTSIIIGYGLAQLGYLLIAGGIIKGTFLFFDLDSRLKTIIMGVCCLFIGSVLSN